MFSHLSVIYAELPLRQVLMKLVEGDPESWVIFGILIAVIVSGSVLFKRLSERQEEWVRERERCRRAMARQREALGANAPAPPVRPPAERPPDQAPPA